MTFNATKQIVAGSIMGLLLFYQKLKRLPKYNSTNPYVY